MVKIARIIPITDLRHDAARILRQVRSSNEPLIITQRGRAAAVMLSVEAYEQAEHDRQLLRVLAQGDKEVAVGSVRMKEDGRLRGRGNQGIAIMSG